MGEYDDEPQQGLPDWLRDPMGIARRRWVAMLAALVVGLAATAVAAWLRAPTYLAEASVLLATQQVDEGLVKPTTPGNPIEGLDALTAKSLSQDNLKALVEELSLYPELAATHSLDERVAELRAAITVEPKVSTNRTMPFPMRGERSRVLGVSFEADDAATASAVANRLAYLFQAEGLRMRGEQARLATDFMRKAVADAEKAVHDQKAKIAAYESQHRGELPTDLEVNQRRVERLQDQRDALLQSAAEAETRAATAAAQAGGDPGASELAALKSALARELGVNRDTHPNVISLRRQIEEAQQNVGGGGGGGGVAAATRKEVAQYRAQIAEADAELARLDEQIARTPQHAAELVALQQRAEALEETYDDLLGKLNETELAQNLEQAQQGAQVVVLQEAQPPTKPEKGRLKVVLAGILGSFALALVAGLALELRDPVIATAAGVESIANVPVLGVIPKVS
jgi:uncharacterized protein involved in exopolysaccharide biosynthesis